MHVQAFSGADLLNKNSLSVKSHGHASYSALLIEKLFVASLVRALSDSSFATMQTMEASLQSEPTSMLHEAILRNLGNMYDLYSPLAGQSSKKSLSSWASHIAPEDFDMSYLQ